VTEVTPNTPLQKQPVSKKSGRRRAREIALQGLYEWLISGAEPALVEANLREHDGFNQCDLPHFMALLHGSIEGAVAIDQILAKYVDRKTSSLSPVEHAALMIAVFELQHCMDIPYKVVINEAVELAKNFGGTDGHKYVNGVLDKACAELRSVEVQAYRAGRALRS
jgi:transcription antitermination protein NusB